MEIQAEFKELLKLFTEHKVDQAWIIDRGNRIADKRIDAALVFVKEKGERIVMYPLVITLPEV